MAMTLSFHENLDLTEVTHPLETVLAPCCNSLAHEERLHLFAEKMRVPEIRRIISRPRLNELLEKSCAQVGATLMTGRAETGKTVLAADYAKNYSSVAWYQVDSAETNWHLFSRYFAAIFDEDYGEFKDCAGDIPHFVEKLFARVAKNNGAPILVVLDDIHNVFDAEWFAGFFATLLYSLAPNVHLLMLSRIKPPQPLWRLRSKQVLGVIDENLLAFNLEETKQFLKQNKIPVVLSARAHAQTFGRISSLKRLVETKSIVHG